MQSRGLGALAGFLVHIASADGGGLSDGWTVYAGQQVFALDQITYQGGFGPVHVYAGTEGSIDEVGSNFRVAWQDPQWTGAVTFQVIERKSCQSSCSGLAEYFRAGQGVHEDERQRCYSLQGHWRTADCVSDLGSERRDECLRMWRHVQADIESCAPLGVDILMPRMATPAPVGTLVGREVIALQQFEYYSGAGNATVPLGAHGTIFSHSGQELEVDWELWDLLRGRVSLSLVENVTCFDECEGLLSYFQVSAAAMSNSSLNTTEKCLLLQGQESISSCALLPYQQPRCPSTVEFLDSRSRLCEQVGISLARPEDMRFQRSACRYCDYVKGAVDVSGDQTPRHLFISLAECAGRCGPDDACKAYDYDVREQQCRLWRSCPPLTRKSMHCSWTLFVKNTLQIASPVATTTTFDASLFTTSDKVAVASQGRRSASHILFVVFTALRFSIEL